jgi:hypothetical protein
MTIGPRSQCDTCIRFRSPWRSESGVRRFCEAFPEADGGIPDEVFRNGLDHRHPIEGDHGVQWESNGEPFPRYAFAAKCRSWHDRVDRNPDA